MLNIRRGAVIAALAGALGVTLTLGVAAPAEAITIGGADELWKYVQTIKGSQLQAASKIGQEAWTRNTARVAATNANLYTAGTIYGNFDPGDLAEVIPLDKPVDYGPGKRVRLGSGARGITLPAYQGSKLQKTLGGVGGQLVAMSAFAFRAEIANGVMSWVGQDDVQGLVCGADLGGVVNFITGQDCDAWAAQEEYEANSGITHGVSGGWSCSTGSANEACLALSGVVTWESAGSMYTAYCFQTTYNGVTRDIPSLNVELRDAAGNWYAASSSAASNRLVWATSGSWCNTYGVPGTTGMASDTRLSNPVNLGARMTEYRALPAGEVVVPVETDMDPERYFECRVHMVSGPVLTGQTAPFRESDREWPEPNCPPTTDGSTPTLVEVYEIGGGESSLVWSQEPTPEHLDWEAEHGDHCAVSSCFLDLVQLSSGKSCFGLAEACDGWMTSPTRDTDYACLYGGVTQPVQECYVYANVFNKQKRLAGNAWADPATGEDLHGGISLRFDEALMGAPTRSPDGIRDCGGAGWGDPNPLEWVLRPIQCALEWAFVPRAAYVEAQGVRLTTALNEHAPGQLATMIGGWHIDPSPMTGCSRSVAWSPATALTGVEGITKLWDVCPGSDLEFLGTASRTVIGVSFAVMVFVVLKRSVGKTVDYS